MNGDSSLDNTESRFRGARTDSTAMTSYFVETTADRLSAIDDAGHEIVGAFLRRDSWTLFFDASFFEPFGVTPLHEHLPLHTRGQAMNLIHVLAMAYLAKSEAAEAA